MALLMVSFSIIFEKLAYKIHPTSNHERYM
jgi:hypothetical protein